MEDLISQVRKGNRQAADRLFRETCDELYSYCMRLCRNESSAQDLMQDTYLTAFNKIEQYRTDKNFRGWLHTIAVNKFYNRIRDEKAVLFTDIPAEELSCSELYITQETAEQRELAGEISDVINSSLSESQRLTVMMYYYDELSVSEIAERLNCPEGTVKTRLYHSRKILRDEFVKRGITLGGTVLAVSAVLNVHAADYTVSAAAAAAVSGIVCRNTAALYAAPALAAKMKIAAGIAAFAVAGGAVTAGYSAVKNKKNETAEKKYLTVTQSSETTEYTETVPEVHDQIISTDSYVTSAEVTAVTDIFSSVTSIASSETEVTAAGLSQSQTVTTVSDTPQTSAFTDKKTEETSDIHETEVTEPAQDISDEYVPGNELSVRHFDSNTLRVSIPENYISSQLIRIGNENTGYRFINAPFLNAESEDTKYLSAGPKTIFRFRPDSPGEDEIIFAARNEMPDEIDITEVLSLFMEDISFTEQQEIVLNTDNTNSPEAPDSTPGTLTGINAVKNGQNITGDVLVFRGTMTSSHIIVFCSQNGKRKEEFESIRNSILISYTDKSWLVH